MDQAFLEREKELFKLNAKLNSKAKKFSTISNKSSVKPVQIHTANSHFNYYDESLAISQKEFQDEESLSCKKINISNQPPKKNHEIIYPLFNRHIVRGSRDHTTDIHILMPGGLTVADGKAEIADSSVNDNISVDFISEAVSGQSFKNESLLTRYSDDTSAVAPTEKIIEHQTPSITNLAVPRTIEKKNISNDGLLK